MRIVYYDPSKDDWSCSDANSERLARELLERDIYTSNNTVMDWIRIFIAEDVLDFNQIEIRFIKSQYDVLFLKFDQYADLNPWPPGFMEGPADLWRQPKAKYEKKKRNQDRVLAQLEKDQPLVELVKSKFYIDPKPKIQTIKTVRTRMPELGLREAKDFVDKIWNELEE